MKHWQASVLNVSLMQACWFACVVGAARGRPWAGPLAVAAMVAVHMGLLSRRPVREGLFIAAAAVFGFFLETGLTASGAHRPAASLLPFPLAPLWMTALWVNFATLLDHSLRWLRGRPVLAAAIGALGGPPAYLAGERLGAVAVGGTKGMLLLAAAWAIALPVLAAGASRAVGDGSSPAGGGAQDRLRNR